MCDLPSSSIWFTVQIVEILLFVLLRGQKRWINEIKNKINTEKQIKTNQSQKQR